MDIKISGLEKSFGKVQALKPLQIVMKQGEFTTLLGPSGMRENDITQNDCRTGRAR